MWLLDCTQEKGNQVTRGAWTVACGHSSQSATCALGVPQHPRPGRPNARRQQPQGACLQAGALPSSPTTPQPSSTVHNENTHNASII